MSAIGQFRESPSNTPVIDAWVARRIVSGWSAPALVAATGGGISLRTAYRWIADIIRLDEVRIGDHVAVFAIRHGKPPCRLGPWRPAS